MRRTSTRYLGLPVLTAALLWTGAAAAGGDWVLMGRHGGCAEIADAARLKPALAGVATPEEFAAKAQREGHAVKVTEMDLGGARGVAADVPSLGHSVVFVPRAICNRTKARQ